MKPISSSFSYVFRLLTALTAVFTVIDTCPLLATNVAAATLPSALTQAQTAFSSGVEVKNVSLTGQVTWVTGSTKDSGTFSAAISEDGSSLMTFVLASRGSYHESYTATGLGRSCEWQGRDQIAHVIDSSLCTLPIAWLLPSVALQPTSPHTSVIDAGLLSIGTHQYNQLDIRAAGFPAATSMGVLANYGVATVDLDPATFLPARTRQTLFPGSNPLSPVAMEVEYSQYVKTSGVQIPRTIVRQLDGATDLTFTVTEVTVSQSSTQL